MSPVIDFHVHAYPDPIAQLESLEPQAVKKLEALRSRVRKLIRPLAAPMHNAQAWLRNLPEPARIVIEPFSSLIPIATLAAEFSVKDLLRTMNETNIDQAVLVAHPPFISNEFVLESHRRYPKQIIAAVNIPPSTQRPGQKLKKYVEQGARILKIHPAYDGLGVDSRHYQALLKTAAELGLPVILHTGCIHSRLAFKDPRMGDVRLFEPWFSEWPELTFILAHMNYHDPEKAIAITEKHENVLVDTSWQPAEVIGEAVRRLGAEKILFGTDWPLMGDNIRIGRSRIQDAIDSGFIQKEDAEKILGTNAARILEKPLRAIDATAT